MCSFRIQGNICGVWQSFGVGVEEVALGSWCCCCCCCCCARDAVLEPPLLCAPSSVSVGTVASSISVKCALLLLLRLLPPEVVLRSEGGEGLFSSSGSRLAEAHDGGTVSGDESEQLGVCLYRASGANPRASSLTAPKWLPVLVRFTVRSMPL